MKYSPLKKSELLQVLKYEWDVRRARVLEKARKNTECVVRWKACEKAISELEKELGRTLTVREYYDMKIKYGIKSQRPDLPSSSPLLP